MYVKEVEEFLEGNNYLRHNKRLLLSVWRSTENRLCVCIHIYARYSFIQLT